MRRSSLINATLRMTSHRQTMGERMPDAHACCQQLPVCLLPAYVLFLRIILGSGSGLWHVVTGAISTLITLVGNVDANPAEGPVLLCVGGSVPDLVLRSKFVVNIEEAAGQVLNLQWEKSLAACFLCELLEGLVTAFLLFRAKEGC